MNLHVVACYDHAAAVYGRPAFYATQGLAVRAFTDEVNRADKGNALHEHPDDFELYALGTFDDVIGKFFNWDVPSLLIKASQVKELR